MPNSALNELYAFLRERHTSGDVVERVESFYLRPERSTEELSGLRSSGSAGHRAYKRLSDEVGPVVRFLKYFPDARHVSFPFSNDPPDCWVWWGDSNESVGLEVTIALGQERARLGKELVEKGISPGFLGFQDGAKNIDFDQALARGRIMYPTSAALTAVRKGVSRSLIKKNKPKFIGMDLLIQAKLNALKPARWEEIMTELRTIAETLPFRRIFLVGEHSEAGAHPLFNLK